MKIILSLLLGFGLGVLFCFAMPQQKPEPNSLPSQTEPPSSQSPSSPHSPPQTNTQAQALGAGSSGISQKKQLLSSLSENDIDEWRKIKNENIEHFLRNNDEYWHSGDPTHTSGPGRLDLAILQSSLGKYECLVKYGIREANIEANYNLTLELNGASANAKNKLQMKNGSVEGGNSMSSNFSWRYLGTDGREINVVWPNMNGNEIRYVSNFAFKLRAGASIGELSKVPLMGLDSSLQWQNIGTVEIKRVR